MELLELPLEVPYHDHNLIFTKVLDYCIDHRELKGFIKGQPNGKSLKLAATTLIRLG